MFMMEADDWSGEIKKVVTDFLKLEPGAEILEKVVSRESVLRGRGTRKAGWEG